MTGNYSLVSPCLALRKRNTERHCNFQAVKHWMIEVPIFNETIVVSRSVTSSDR